MRTRLLAVLVGVLTAGAALAATPVDGTWLSTSDAKDRVTFTTTADTITMAASSRTGYTAKLDGTQAPLKGEKEPLMVSVKMASPGVLDEITYKAGKPWLHFRMEVAADGKNAKVSWKNLVDGSTGGYSMKKQ